MIWLNTERGNQLPNTVMSGHLRLLRQVGRRIRTVAGCGCRPGAGLGWIPLLGALRLSITVVGLITVRDGAGCLGHVGCGRFMRLHSSVGWEGRAPACLLPSAEAPALVGFRS